MQILKNKILLAMERSLECYTEERIKNYIKTVKEEGLKEHGFARLGANLAFLIANGKKTEFKKYLLEIMDICAEQIPKVKAANEFSIKELILAINQLEKVNFLEKEQTERWKKALALQQPFNLYKKVYTLPDRLSNWAVFAATSEWLRVAFSLNGDRDFVDKQLATQTQWFDENGCYLDAHNPMVYDVVTRQLLCFMLKFGYDGKFKEFLDNNLEKAGFYTLKILSINGEMPFGGRSNQFIHNEALFVPVLMHEAERHYKRGNTVLAGQFKSAAIKCLDKTLQNLEFYKGRHVKNFYHLESKIGCESYAYFDKYMITTASNLQLALYYNLDEIEPIPAPFEKGGYIFETSKEFNKVFLFSKEYSLQLDLWANEHYDSAGLGRIHKKGAPETICLSTPFASKPSYKISGENDGSFSICPAIIKGKKLFLGADTKTKYSLVKKEIVGDKVTVVFKCVLSNKNKLLFTCSVNQNEVEIKVNSPFKKLGICFPVFSFDGEKKTEIERVNDKIVVKYAGFICEYFGNKLATLNKKYYNRNGEYQGFIAKGVGKTTLKIKIDKERRHFL